MSKAHFTRRSFGLTHTMAEELVAVFESPDDVWALGLTTQSRPSCGHSEAFPTCHFLCALLDAVQSS